MHAQSLVSSPAVRASPAQRAQHRTHMDTHTHHQAHTPVHSSPLGPCSGSAQRAAPPSARRQTAQARGPTHCCCCNCLPVPAVHACTPAAGRLPRRRAPHAQSRRAPERRGWRGPTHRGP